MSNHQGPRPMDWQEEEERLLRRAIATRDVTGWFDDLYAAGASGRVQLPWSRTEPHPLLVAWAAERRIDGGGLTAIVVGCALRADAEYLANLGFNTTGFDVAPTAIALARRRHPNSRVRYRTADILDPPTEWRHAFDLVVEIITVQALPRPTNHARSSTSGASLLPVARCSSSLRSTAASRASACPNRTRSAEPGLPPLLPAD